MYVLLLAQGFEEVEAVTPADFLRRAGVELRLVGVTSRIVEGNHGIRIEADTTLGELGAAAGGVGAAAGGVGAAAGEDVAEAGEGVAKSGAGGEEIEGIILPGGMPGAANLAASQAVLSLIRRLFAAGRLVAAICAAPAVTLTAAGVVKDRRVTCFPGFEERFEATGARFVAERVVEDGNLITSRGAGTAAEFALQIIARIAGREKALEVHRRTLQPGPDPGPPPGLA